MEIFFSKFLWVHTEFKNEIESIVTADKVDQTYLNISWVDKLVVWAYNYVAQKFKFQVISTFLIWYLYTLSYSNIF